MKAGVLLIHGFTATPAVLGYLKNQCEKAGFITESPLLAGHGEPWDHLAEAGWRDWLLSAEEGFHRLRQKADTITIAGHSMGGMLALELALKYPKEIKKVVCLATPFYVDGWNARFLLPFIQNTPLRYFIKWHAKDFASSVHDPVALEEYKRISHAWMPLTGVYSLQEIQAHLRAHAKEVSQPILFLCAAHDYLMSKKSRDFMKIGFQNAVYEEVTRSGHVLVLDYDKEEVAQRVIGFCKAD